MLTIHDLRYNLFIFRLCSTLTIFPMTFDKRTGEMSGHKSITRKTLFRTWQFGAIIHTLYILSRSLQHTVFRSSAAYVRPKLIPIFLVGSVVFSALNYITYEISIKWLKLNIKLSGLLLAVKDFPVSVTQESELVEKTSIKRKKSYMELLICFFPLLLYPGIIGCPIFYIFEPTLPVLLISSIHPGSQTIGIFCLVLSIEMLAVLFYISYIHLTVYFVLSCFQTLTENVDSLLVAIGSDEMDVVMFLPRTIKKVRLLTFDLTLFNLAFSNVVYMFKIGAMTAAISGGYGVLRLHSSNVPFAVIYLFFFINSVVTFIGLFNSAFQIPEKIWTILWTIRVQSQRLGNPVQRIYYRVAVRAISNKGVKVGGFGYMQSESTPQFCDFVINNILDLLLAF